MTKNTFLWTLLGCAFVLGILWQFYPLETAAKRMDDLPTGGKNFTSQEIELTPFEKTFFTGVNVVKRVYKIDNRYYFVSILDGTHNRHIVHDPFYCFKGSGWTIVSEQSFPLKNGSGKLINISKDKEVKEALFWFSNGTQQYHSPLQYWWETTLRRLSLGHSGPEPVLIMIQPLDQQSVDWTHIINVLKALNRL